MAQPAPFSTLLVASHNSGKIAEFTEILKPLGISVKGAAEMDLAEPEETGTTFRDNAILKAQLAAKAANEVALADDSGLCVDALGGQPGLYSARWIREKGREGAFSEIRRAVESSGNPRARFICELALVYPSGKTHTFQGIAEGTLVFPPRGEKGFGYDPIFQPLGHKLTFAEIDEAQKHKLSHRGQAVRKFFHALSR